MKKVILVVLLMNSFVGLCQTAYYSPFTHLYSTIFTSTIEEVDRRITFEPNTITIVTVTEIGKEIEILTVHEVAHYDGTVSIFCTTRNNRKVTIVLPKQERVEIIDYFSHDPKTQEDYQLRFYVEREP